MTILHICFILSDVFVYHIELSILIADIILLWFDFYNYMLLNKVTVLIEVVIHALIFVVSLTHLQRVILEGFAIIIIVFIIQFLVVYPLIAATVGKRLYDHYM